MFHCFSDVGVATQHHKGFIVNLRGYYTPFYGCLEVRNPPVNQGPGKEKLLFLDNRLLPELKSARSALVLSRNLCGRGSQKPTQKG
jgi:hypothetical protein